jgi:hypothetical protein
MPTLYRMQADPRTDSRIRLSFSLRNAGLGVRVEQLDGRVGRGSRAATLIAEWYLGCA